MLSNLTLIFCIALTILIAQFSPFTALLISIGLGASEVISLWIEDAKRVNKINQ